MSSVEASALSWAAWSNTGFSTYGVADKAAVRRRNGTALIPRLATLGLYGAPIPPFGVGLDTCPDNPASRRVGHTTDVIGRNLSQFPGRRPIRRSPAGTTPPSGKKSSFQQRRPS